MIGSQPEASVPPEGLVQGWTLGGLLSGAKPGRWIAECVGTMSRVVSAASLHVELVARPSRGFARPGWGLPDERGGAVGGRADRRSPRWRSDDAAARAWLARRQRPDGGYRRARAGVTTARRPRRSRRSPSTAGRRPACARASRSRTAGCRFPNAGRPRAPHGLGLDRRHAVARRADRPRPARRERADAARPSDAAEARRAARGRVSAPTAAGTSATRPSTTSTCAGYAQTTAMALIALQDGDRSALVARGARRSSADAGGSSPAG